MLYRQGRVGGVYRARVLLPTTLPGYTALPSPSAAALHVTDLSVYGAVVTAWAQHGPTAWVREPGGKSGPGSVKKKGGFLAGRKTAQRAGKTRNQIATGQPCP